MSLTSQPSGHCWPCQIWFSLKVDFLPGDLQGQPCKLSLEGIPFSLSSLSIHTCLISTPVYVQAYFSNVETILTIYMWWSLGLYNSIIKNIYPVEEQWLTASHTTYIVRGCCLRKKKFSKFWRPGKNIWSFMTMLYSITSHNLSFREKMDI